MILALMLMQTVLAFLPSLLIMAVSVFGSVWDREFEHLGVDRLGSGSYPGVNGSG